MKKQILSLFLVLGICLSLVPAVGATEVGQADGVWAAIEALEQKELPARPTAADCEGLMPRVEALVTTREDYVPGSGTYKDGVFHWQTADGTNCGYDPEMRATIINAVPMPEAERIAAEREADRAAELAGTAGEAVLMSGDPEARDVAVFIPWWGKDVIFGLDLYYTGVKLANATGGVCKRYLGEEVTVDAIADALTTCCVVIINTHGATGLITVCSGEGIRAGDHAYSAGDGSWAVEGQCIRDHLPGPVTAGFVSLNACACMGSEELSNSLREAGVDLVFGWSQPVSSGICEWLTDYFADGLVQGMTAAKASVYAKQQMCTWALTELLSFAEGEFAMLEAAGKVDWDIWRSKGALTAEQAKENGAAFPLYVSAQDPYPGVEHKDEIQTVKSTWKLPLDKSAQTNIRTWGTVDHYFAAFFPDAVEKITLLSGSLPPGIGIGSKDYVWSYEDYYEKKTIVNLPCLYGIPTSPGYYEATLKVELEGGKTETRTARIVITQEGVTKTEQELTLDAGEDRTVFFSDGHTGEIFTVEAVSSRAPAGMTFLWDGGKPRLCGAPSNAGWYNPSYRIVTASGKVYEHTVRIIVPAEYRQTSESLLLRYSPDTETQVPLNFEGADRVSTMELISGQVPPGMTFGCSMSDAPHYRGTPWTKGTYQAVFRAVLTDCTVVTHKVTATVYGEAESIDLYSMDLSLGETTVPKNDMDVWLNRSLSCMVSVGQIGVKNNTDGSASLDLDKDGTWDVQNLRTKDGAVIFRQLDSSSLTGNDYTLIMNSKAIDKADQLWLTDKSARYTKQIDFHLNTDFDLYIAGTQVTSRNRADILGNGNGEFSFDGVNTLFIHQSYTAGVSEYVIRNGINGLTIRTDEDCTLSSYGNCIETTRSLSLTGTGQLSLRSETGSGIVCEKSLLTVYNTSLVIQANQGKGITGRGDGSVHARLSRANLSLRTGEGAMDGFWSIGMYGCRVWNPVRGVVGTISSRNCLVDENNTLLNTVQITAYDTKYDLTIDGIPVTDRNRADVLRDGTFSFDGDHTLTVSKSYECIDRLPAIESSIDGLVIQAAPDVVLSSYRTCVSLGGTTTLTGGPLTVISTSKALSQGILLEADVSLLVSDMTLTARGGRNGIRGSEGSGKLVITENAVVTASGAAAAIQIPGGLEQCMAAYPEGASVYSGTVVESAGDPASEAVLRFFREFDLMINGTPVTTQNMHDLGSSFSFDGDRTLTVRGDCRSEFNIIENSMDGLVIYVERDAVLSTEPEYEWEMPIGSPLFTGADLTITGPGKLTLRGGINPGLSAAYGAEVTVKDASLETNTLIGASSGTALVLDHARVNSGTLMGFDGGITLTGCGIASPPGGRVLDGAVVTAEGTPAGEVTVVPMSFAVTGDTLDYTLILPADGRTASLIAAWYDGEGRLLGCAVRNVTQNGLTTGTITVEKEQKEYRLFALDGENGAPLIQALTWTR